MTIAELLEVYRKIADKEDPHGEFLTLVALAAMHADGENLRLIRPLLVVLGIKYRLWPGAADAAAEACTNAALEQTAIRLAVTSEAKGVVIVLLHHNDRVEVVAGLREEAPDLPEVMQKLADRVKDGDGQPVGNHLHTIIPP